VAVHRTSEENGIHEAFRTLRPRAGKKLARAFSFFEVGGEIDEEPGEVVDVIGMVERRRKLRTSGFPAATICSIAIRAAACC